MKTLFALFIFSVFGISVTAPAFTIQVDTDGERILAWASNKITFDVNSADCVAQGVSEARLNAAIDKAMSVWNEVGTADVRLSRGEAVSKSSADIEAQTKLGNPLILCSADLDTVLKDSDGKPAETNNIPAVTRVLRVDSGRHIAVAAVYINAVSGQPASVGKIIDEANVLEVILAHEIGHAIGLGHAKDVNALMYYNASAKNQLALGRDDVDGLNYLYPRKELGGSGILGCGTLTFQRPDASKPRPGTGLGTAAELIGLIALAWWGTRAGRRPTRPLDAPPLFA